jgi:hypothetical protein
MTSPDGAQITPTILVDSGGRTWSLANMGGRVGTQLRMNGVIRADTNHVTVAVMKGGVLHYEDGTGWYAYQPATNNFASSNDPRATVVQQLLAELPTTPAPLWNDGGTIAVATP